MNQLFFISFSFFLIYFYFDIDSSLIAPAPITMKQYLNESPKADIKNIVLVSNKIDQQGLVTSHAPILILRRNKNQAQLDGSVSQRYSYVSQQQLCSDKHNC